MTMTAKMTTTTDDDDGNKRREGMAEDAGSGSEQVSRENM
jgi:hypothetical protein